MVFVDPSSTIEPGEEEANNPSNSSAANSANNEGTAGGGGNVIGGGNKAGRAIAMRGAGTSTDFVACYLHHYGRLVKALRLAGADPGTAEETAQEAFAVALVRWNRVVRGTNPAGYVYTTAFRLLRKHLARTSRWDVGDPPESARADDDTTGAAAAGHLDVEAALALMAPRQRACAVMCLVLDVSTGDAAEALGIAAGTVRKHLDAARARLEVAVRPDTQ